MAISAADIKKYALDPNLSYQQKVALAKQHGIGLGQISQATGLDQRALSNQARNELGIRSATDLLRGAQDGTYNANQAMDLAYGIGGTPQERMSVMRQAKTALPDMLRPWQSSGHGSLVGGRASAGALDQLISGGITPELAAGNITNPLRSFRSTGPNSLMERVGQNEYTPVTGKPFEVARNDPATGLPYYNTGPAWAGATPYGAPIDWSGSGNYKDASWAAGASAGPGAPGGAQPQNPGGTTPTIPNQIPGLPWQGGAAGQNSGLTTALPNPNTTPVTGNYSLPGADFTQRGTMGPNSGLTTALPNPAGDPITDVGGVQGTAGQGWQSAQAGTPVPGFPGINARPGLPTPQELLPGPVTGPAQLGGAPMTDAKALQLMHATLPVTDVAERWLAPLQDEVTRDITRAYAQNVMPTIGRNSVATGGYGSSRQGIAEGLAAQSMGDAISRELAQLRSNTYERGLDRSLQATSQLNQNELQRQQMALQGQIAATGLLPQLQNAQFQGLSQVSNIGDAYQRQMQDMINADKSQWDYWQNLPAQQLAQYMAMIQGNVGQLGGTTSTNQSGGGFSGAGALGGALGASALGSTAAGGSGLAALAGLGGGIPLAVLGALAGGLL